MKKKEKKNKKVKCSYRHIFSGHFFGGCSAPLLGVVIAD